MSLHVLLIKDDRGMRREKDAEGMEGGGWIIQAAGTSLSHRDLAMLEVTMSTTTTRHQKHETISPPPVRH